MSENEYSGTLKDSEILDESILLKTLSKFNIDLSDTKAMIIFIQNQIESDLNTYTK